MCAGFHNLREMAGFSLTYSLLGHFLLQEVFPTQGSNPHLRHQQAGSLPLSHLGRRYFQSLLEPHAVTSVAGHSPSGHAGPPQCRGLGSALLVISQVIACQLITVHKNHDNSKLFE